MRSGVSIAGQPMGKRRGSFGEGREWRRSRSNSRIRGPLTALVCEGDRMDIRCGGLTQIDGWSSWAKAHY